MSKRSGNRTGRQAKRRRRRHQRRTSDAMHRLHLIVDGEPVRDWSRLRAALRIGIDGAGGTTRAGKTARMAEIAELWRRPGRVVVSRPPPDLAEERPLTDAELALRYALERAFSGLDGWRGLSAGYGGGSSDWSATYLPPKDGE